MFDHKEKAGGGVSGTGHAAIAGTGVGYRIYLPVQLAGGVLVSGGETGEGIKVWTIADGESLRDHFVPALWPSFVAIDVVSTSSSTCGPCIPI